MGPKRRSQPRSEPVLASHAQSLLSQIYPVELANLSFSIFIIFQSGLRGGEAMTSFKMCSGVARHSRPSAALHYCPIDVITPPRRDPMHQAIFSSTDNHQNFTLLHITKLCLI